MFDLEYYNKITDFANFIDNRISYTDKTPIIKYRDYKNYNLDLNNKCDAFAFNLKMYENMIGAEYMIWYENYKNSKS